MIHDIPIMMTATDNIAIMGAGKLLILTVTCCRPQMSNCVATKRQAAARLSQYCLRVDPEQKSPKRHRRPRRETAMGVRLLLPQLPLETSDLQTGLQ